MNVPKAKYEIFYNGTNITGSIVPYIKNFVYTDKAKGEADEIELTLEDSDKLWQNDWYPTKGDTLQAKIYVLGQELNCGVFTVDEIESSASQDEGDTIVIKGIAASINDKLRTKNSYAHENNTLREIANTIASKFGFKIQGNIDEIRMARETQYNETDLHFLQRIASEYGYTFSVRDKLLTFTNIFEIESKAEALTIHRSEMISRSITDKTSNTYKAVKISYHNPKQKTVISHEQSENEKAYKDAKSDTLVIHLRCENQQQAEIKSKVALYRANSLQQSGNVTMPGNVLALAGNNVQLTGCGVFSGKYHITQSTHNVSADSSYTTDIEIKRTGLIDAKLNKD